MIRVIELMSTRQKYYMQTVAQNEGRDDEPKAFVICNDFNVEKRRSPRQNINTALTLPDQMWTLQCFP